MYQIKEEKNALRKIYVEKRENIDREKKKKLDALAKANRYFILMDENKFGDHDYPDQMSFNRDHLCVAGKKQLTDRLDSVLKTLKW